jgi:hypothetical protein
VADPNPRTPLLPAPDLRLIKFVCQTLRPPVDEAAAAATLALQPNGKKHHVEGTNSPNIKSKDLNLDSTRSKGRPKRDAADQLNWLRTN